MTVHVAVPATAIVALPSMVKVPPGRRTSAAAIEAATRPRTKHPTNATPQASRRSMTRKSYPGGVTVSASGTHDALCCSEQATRLSLSARSTPDPLRMVPPLMILARKLDQLRSRDPLRDVPALFDTVHLVPHGMDHERRDADGGEGVPHVNLPVHLPKGSDGAGAGAGEHPSPPPSLRQATNAALAA